MKEHIIWDGTFYEFETLAKECRDDYEDIYPGKPDAWWYEFAQETYYSYLDDERENLDIPTDGQIIIIADLGLWNGRKTGIKLLNTCNVNAVLGGSYVNGDIKYYADRYNVRADDYHHDGTNHYLFREVRKDRNINNLIDRVMDGEVITSSIINYYTKSIVSYVNKVYGW